MVACLMWQVIGIMRIENPELQDMAALRILTLICSFGFSLTLSNKNIIFDILTILGTTQAFYAIAQQIGRHVLTQPVKVENTFTLRAKKEIKDWFTYTQ